MTRENIQMQIKNKMTLIKSFCELFSWACKFLFRPGTTHRYTCPKGMCEKNFWLRLHNRYCPLPQSIFVYYFYFILAGNFKKIRNFCFNVTALLFINILDYQ